MSYYKEHRSEILAKAKERYQQNHKPHHSQAMTTEERREYMRRYCAKRREQDPEAHERYKEHQRKLSYDRWHSEEAKNAREVKKAWKAQSGTKYNADAGLFLFPASALYQISDNKLHYFSATKWNKDGTPVVYSRTLTPDVVELLNTTRIVNRKRLHLLTECEMQAINRWVINSYMNGDETLTVTYRSDDKYMIQGLTPGIETYAAPRT